MATNIRKNITESKKAVHLLSLFGDFSRAVASNYDSVQYPPSLDQVTPLLDQEIPPDDTINLNTLNKGYKSLETLVRSDVANPPELTQEEYDKINQEDEPKDTCEGGGYIAHQCEDHGHVITTRIGCNKEYCPSCGEQWSLLHQQRYYRAQPKAHYLFNEEKPGLGYFVFTIPEEVRNQVGREELRTLQKYMTRYMKRLGFDKGFSMWHWCGEDGYKWNPHLNVLINAGYLKNKLIEEIKADWRRRINNMLGVDLEKIVVNYSYRNIPAKVNHTVRYVTRPTWQVYSHYIEERVFNYRNARWWGDWTNASLEENDFSKVEKSVCPVCGGKLRFMEEVGFFHSIERSEWVHLVGGTYLWKYKPRIDSS